MASGGTVDRFSFSVWRPDVLSSSGAKAEMMKGPSPSAPVVSVVAKGAKLQVIGRKGRWVQVTHSSTSKSGWVYTGNVATAR